MKESVQILHTDENPFNKYKSGEKENGVDSSREFDLRSVNMADCQKVRETAEYLCQLSTLIPQMQKYEASIVAIS